MSKEKEVVTAKSSHIYRREAPPIVLALSSEDFEALAAALDQKKSFICYAGEVAIEIERRSSYWIKRKGGG